jgi:hypothetical protein
LYSIHPSVTWSSSRKTTTGARPKKGLNKEEAAVSTATFYQAARRIHYK